MTLKYNQLNIILVRLFLVAVLFISFLYLYFVNVTIQSVIENKQNLKNLQIISQEYQKLESQYFVLLNKFDIDYARQLGFVDRVQKADYVVRQSAFARR